MITDDPIADLERELVRVATSGPRRRRGPRRVAAAVAVVAALAVVAVVLAGGGASNPSLVARAYAALAPGGTIVHLRFAARTNLGGGEIARTRGEIWSTAQATRARLVQLGPRTGRVERLEDEVRTRTRIVAYESAGNTLTTTVLCGTSRRPRASGLSLLSAQHNGVYVLESPLTALGAVIAAHSLRDAGPALFAGVPAERLVAPGRVRHVVFVSRSTGIPIALIEIPPLGAGPPTITRISGVSRLPLDRAGRALLHVGRHPTARHLTTIGGSCRR